MIDSDTDTPNSPAGYSPDDDRAPNSAISPSGPLAGIAAELRGLLTARTRLAIAEVTDWVRRYPIIEGLDGSGSRVAFCGLSAAVTFPDSPPTVLADRVKSALALFAHDDLMDGALPGYSIEQLTRHTENCVAVCEGRAVGSGPQVSEAEQQVLSAFRDCFASFADYPGFEWARGYLLRHWRLGFAAMLQESRWRLGADAPPDLTRYLDVAGLSIFGSPMFGLLVALSEHGPLSRYTLRRWDSVLCRADLTVRLCNDLRTADRAQREHTPNALALIEATGQTRAQATRLIETHIAAALADLEQAIDTLPAALAEPGESLRRNTRFLHRWYFARDTSGVTGAELDRLLTEFESSP